MAKKKQISRKPPNVGQWFTRRHKKKSYTMTVVNTLDGVKYEVAGKLFSSPSSAAKYVAGYWENGYSFGKWID
jgi:hypothetical protein